ncbi:unnamed protein product [Sphagnum jensenii]|uniref:Secreted protein n=1 Tax=Sphagnum jensenii TaxID=128206 RepID=A0ABP1BB43_9BRYO
MIKNAVAALMRGYICGLCFFAKDCSCGGSASRVVRRDSLFLRSWAAEGDLVEVVRLYGSPIWLRASAGGKEVDSSLVFVVVVDLVEAL